MLAYHFRRVLNTCLPGSTGRGLGLESGWWICTHSSNSSGDNMGLYRYGLMYFVSAVFSVRRTLLFCDVWNGWKRKVQCQRYWLSVWPANWVWPSNCVLTRKLCSALKLVFFNLKLCFTLRLSRGKIDRGCPWWHFVSTDTEEYIKQVRYTGHQQTEI